MDTILWVIPAKQNTEKGEFFYPDQGKSVSCRRAVSFRASVESNPRIFQMADIL